MECPIRLRHPKGDLNFSTTGWFRTANKAKAIIGYIKLEVAAVNRDFIYVPGITMLSLDDDHLCISSRSVLTFSYLQQNNHPRKGLGLIGNALSSALHPLFNEIDFSQDAEKLLDIWQ